MDPAADIAVSVDVSTPIHESLRVVAFNTESGPEMLHDHPPDGGYSCAHAEITDTWSGNGLAFELRIQETSAFFAALDLDIVAFQEIFSTTRCGDIPKGFICDGWAPGDLSVADRLLGAEYDVQCIPASRADASQSTRG